MELRLAKPSDAPKWTELLRVCLGDDYPNKSVYDAIYVSSLLDPSKGEETWLVVNGDKIHASATILSPADFINNPVINLGRVLFSPESYSDGSAKALIDKICKISANQKAFVVTRAPIYDIEQQKLYESCGFICVGFQPNKHLISTHKGFLFYVYNVTDILNQRMTLSESLSHVGTLATAVLGNFGVVNPLLIRDNIAGYPLQSDYEIADAVVEEFHLWKMQTIGTKQLPEVSTGANRGIGFLRIPAQVQVSAFLAKDNDRVLAGIAYFYDELDKCVRIVDGFSTDDISLGAVLQKVVRVAREKYSAAYVEADILAISPMLLKCAEQMGFTPCAFFPGFFRVGDHISDVVKVVKMNVNYDPEIYPLTEQSSKVVKIIDDNFYDQKSGIAIINLLRCLPTLQGLGDGELRKIAKLFTQKLYRPGEVIFKQGDQGDEAFVVMRGQVDICLSSENKPIATIGTGQIFGEQAFLDGAPRTAMAVASQASILLIIKRQAFNNLIQREPNLGMVIMKNIAMDLSNKLRNANLTLMGTKQQK